jgi:sphingolipid delta-4 desaturase
MAPNNDPTSFELFTHMQSNLDGPTDDFFWVPNEEPHATRRKLILKKYPKVQELFGYEPRTKYIVTLLVLAQVVLAHFLRNSYDTWYFYLIAYVIGGTINHALFLAIHEISHNLAFKTLWPNRLLAMFGNLPIGLPYYASFKVYHNEHHKYQGVDTVDTDLPTKIEGKIFRGVISKALFW